MNGGVIGKIDVQTIHGYGRSIIADQDIKPGYSKRKKKKRKEI